MLIFIYRNFPLGAYTADREETRTIFLRAKIDTFNGCGSSFATLTVTQFDFTIISLIYW